MSTKGRYLKTKIYLLHQACSLVQVLEAVLRFITKPKRIAVEVKAMEGCSWLPCMQMYTHSTIHCNSEAIRFFVWTLFSLLNALLAFQSHILHVGLICGYQRFLCGSLIAMSVLMTMALDAGKNVA